MERQALCGKLLMVLATGRALRMTFRSIVIISVFIHLLFLYQLITIAGLALRSELNSV